MGVRWLWHLFRRPDEVGYVECAGCGILGQWVTANDEHGVRRPIVISAEPTVIEPLLGRPPPPSPRPMAPNRTPTVEEYLMSDTVVMLALRELGLLAADQQFRYEYAHGAEWDDPVLHSAHARNVAYTVAVQAGCVPQLVAVVDLQPAYLADVADRANAGQLPNSTPVFDFARLEPLTNAGVIVGIAPAR